MTRMRNPLLLVAMVGVLLLAAALRLHMVSVQNLNWDEAYTHWITGLPYHQMLETTARDVHPPLFYTLVSPLRMNGPEAAWLPRLLSVWAGVVGVALAYRLGVAVAGQRDGLFVGVLAALLLAISRAHIEISQLARMHVLSVAFVTAMLWATVVFLRDERGRRATAAAAAYVLATLGALYTFYLSVTGPVAANLVFLVAWWRRGRPWSLLGRWLALQLVVAAVVIPWALYVLPRMQGYTVEAQNPDVLFFLQVYAVTLITGLSTGWATIFPLVLVTAGVVALGTIVLLWTSRATEREAVLLLVVALVGPPLLLVLLIELVNDISRPLAVRYLLPTLAAFSVLAAWGIVAIGRTRPRGIGLLAGVSGAAVIGGAALFGLSNNAVPATPHDDFASAGLHLAAHRFPDDAFVLHTDFDWRRVQIHHDGPRLDVPHRLAVDAGYADLLLAQTWAESDAVWLLLTPGAQVNDPTGIIRRWLEERAVDSRVWRFNANRLFVFARTPERAATLDDLAPDSRLRALPADPVTDIIAVERPFDRYPVGDTLILAVTRDTPGAESALAVRCGAVEREITVPPAPDVTGGPSRQQIAILLTPDLPSGRCTLTLDAFIDLGTFTLLPANDGFLVDSMPMDAVTADIRFGEAMSLAAYTSSHTVLAAGDALDMTAYWQAADFIDTRYKVGVFLLGTAFNPATGGPLWAQVDAEPGNWQFPTTRWPPGTIVRDRYTLALPENTPPGEYLLGVVVYGATDGVRLPAFAPDGTAFADDLAMLRTITVE